MIARSPIDPYVIYTVVEIEFKKGSAYIHLGEVSGLVDT